MTDPTPAPRAAGRPLPRLILHAGTPKTGTTAIQSALHRDRARLLAAGAWYPPISDYFPVSPRLNSARAHFAFAAAVARDSAADRKRIAAFTEAMADRAGSVDRIVISAENLYRLTAAPPPGRPRETPLDKRHRYLARLAAVTERFAPEILLYLRRVDRFAESLYAETMVQTPRAWTFAEFIANLAPRFDYRLQIDTFAAHFPVRVHGFEAAARDGLLESFCTHAGLPGPLPAGDDRTRPSISNTAALWLAAAKRDTPAMPDLEREHRWHFALRPENAGLFDTGAPAGLWESRDARDAFIETHQARVGEIAFPPPDAAFAPPARWPATRHAEAETRFAAWRRSNRMRLLKRRLLRTPPFVLDD